MTEDFAEVDVKIHQSLEGVDFTKGGELLLTHIGIELATPQLADISLLESAHYMAVENWLEYKPKPDASNLEQVRGYLEAFHHLCELEAWETASKLLFIYLNLPNPKELHEQLGTWGYYREQIEFYSRLLHKLNQDLDCILLHGLGRAYRYLGQPQTAIDYHERQLIIAQKIHNLKAEAEAQGGLGEVYYWCLRKFPIAVEHYKQQLAIAHKIADLKQEAEALDGLGYVYGAMGRFQKSIKYCQKAFKIACEIGEQDMNLNISVSLAGAYCLAGHPEKAIEPLRQQLILSRQTSNHRQEWVAITNLGVTYLALKQYQSAIENLHKALEIICTIGDRVGEIVTLQNLGVTYAHLKQHDKAIECLQKSLLLIRQVGNRSAEGWTIALLSYSYSCLNHNQKAIRYSKLSIKIARQLNERQLKGLALATFTYTYWQRKKYFLCFILFAMCFIILQPWNSINGQIIFRIIVKEIDKLIYKIIHQSLSFFQFKQRNEKPTQAREDNTDDD